MTYAQLKSVVFILVITLLISCNANNKKATHGAKGEQEQVSDNNDEMNSNPNSSPSAVMETIFDAAKTGEVDVLQLLLPPNGEGEVDGDCKAICNPGNESMRDELRGNYMTIAQFKDAFANGKIVGEPDISGDKASVNFVFGPNREESETMNMQRISGKWYLSSF